MRLRVLQSGSDGNGYILYNESEALVIECGVPYSRCLKALDFNRRLIVGAVVSHEHGDHAKYTKQYLNAAIPVMASKGTLDAILRGKEHPCAKPVANKGLALVGGFRIMPFSVQHDAAEPFGYAIYHDEMGVCLFATDTYYLKYNFEGLGQIMLECNYEHRIIDKNVEDGVIPPIVRDRVFRSHMSLDTAISTLTTYDLSQVSNIVLIHLSSNNSDAELFKRKVESATGKLVNVATRDLDIPFNKEVW